MSEKFSPNVETTNTVSRTTVRSGLPRAYRKPSRTCPLVRGAGADRVSSSTRIHSSEANTATKDTELTRNTGPVPINVMSTPATAGPTMRAALNIMEFNAIALANRSGPTISIVNDWRTGVSRAVTQPSANASTYTCHSCTTPPTSSSPRINPNDAIATSETIRMRRLSYRSASSPPYIDRNSVGPNCRSITTPTAKPSPPERVRTNQSCAIRCIHVPTRDTI